MTVPGITNTIETNISYLGAILASLWSVNEKAL